MTKTLYHGSNAYIENELIPHKSFHYKPYVYATSDSFYVLVRCGKFDANSFLIKEDYDGETFTLVELKENAFEEVFDTDGYIYIVDNSSFVHDDNCMPNEYISEDNCKIEKTLYIDNVFKYIKKFAEYPYNKFNLIRCNESDEYWKTVRGGKEGYLQRRKDRLNRLKECF